MTKQYKISQQLQFYEKAFLDYDEFYDLDAYLSHMFTDIQYLNTGHEISAFRADQLYVIALGYGSIPRIPVHELILQPCVPPIQHRELHCSIYPYVSNIGYRDRSEMQRTKDELARAGIMWNDCTNPGT